MTGDAVATVTGGSNGADEGWADALEMERLGMISHSGSFCCGIWGLKDLSLPLPGTILIEISSLPSWSKLFLLFGVGVAIGAASVNGVIASDVSVFGVIANPIVFSPSSGTSR